MQLYGMSDNLTYNLANAGYNTAGCTCPTAPVLPGCPYLLRRADENTHRAGSKQPRISFGSKEIVGAKAVSLFIQSTKAPQRPVRDIRGQL
jgi:proline dehydrogenase